MPTPDEMVEKMLDMANVTPNDFVIDLGSGDGRNVIAAAKRGAQALGVEYNEDLVEYSRQNAAKAGVADKATFVQGDMFEADISKATVMALFLLPDNLRKLRPKLLALQAGHAHRRATRSASRTGRPDETKTYEDGCTSWCTIMLWIVPAKADGTWKSAQGDLTLSQDAQMLAGSLGGAAVEGGRLRGEQITFTVAGEQYSGTVKGNTIEGIVKGPKGERKWTATRTAAAQ